MNNQDDAVFFFNVFELWKILKCCREQPMLILFIVKLNFQHVWLFLSMKDERLYKAISNVAYQRSTLQDVMYWCIQTFPGLKWHLILSNLIEALIFYNWKKDQKLILVFHYYFYMLHQYLRQTTAGKFSFSMCYIT